jgi:hypothetical protein
MKTIRILLAALALVAIAPAQDVTSNFDPNTDFTKYKTYKWVDIPGGVKVDDILARQLTGAVDAELAPKGSPRQTATPQIYMWATRSR